MNFNMPGVYKIHMVRMYNNTDELANVHVYILANWKIRKWMRWSKIEWYETPYIFMGDIVFTGIEQAPKCIYLQIDLMEQGKIVDYLRLRRRK